MIYNFWIECKKLQVICVCVCEGEWQDCAEMLACVLLKTHHPLACLAHCSPSALPLIASHGENTWKLDGKYYQIQCTEHLFLFFCPYQTSGGKALSRLKHLQQSGSEKIKTSKQREDFLKNHGQQQVWSICLYSQLFFFTVNCSVVYLMFWHSCLFCLIFCIFFLSFCVSFYHSMVQSVVLGNIVFNVIDCCKVVCHLLLV